MVERLDRQTFIDNITTFLSGLDPRMLRDIRRALVHEIDAAGQSALTRLVERLTTDGADWSYYPPDPLARRIHHVLADRILLPGSTLFGVEHVTALADAQVVIFSNSPRAWYGDSPAMPMAHSLISSKVTSMIKVSAFGATCMI